MHGRSRWWLLRLLAASYATLLAACGAAEVEGLGKQAPAVAPVSVLLLADEPTWSFRYFRNAWRRDPTIALRTYVAEQSVHKAARKPLGQDMESPPTTIAELEAFDVVVLCDWDPAQAGERFPLQLATFVERGGGLITMLAGSAARSYSGASWRKILPVLVPHADAAVPRPVGPSALRVVGPGRQTAFRKRLLDLGSDRTAAELLPQMPGIYFTPSVFALAESSEVILVADVEAAFPTNAVVVARPVGKGHSLWVGSDDLWRWRDPHAERYFGPFAVAMAHAVAGR